MSHYWLRARVIVSIGLLCALPSLGAQHAEHASTPTRSRPDRLGVVSFENSGSRAAQADFLKGLALLLSFMYEESAKAFQRAQRKDGGFAMAYWGEALTYVRTGWRIENLPAASAALARLAATPDARLARAGTPRERSWGAAVEALVAPSVSEPVRVKAFADSMRGIAAAYPRDLDARAMAALGGSVVNFLWPPADSAQRAHDHDVAEGLAISVFRESPRHPGGAHYIIHANDDPVYAARGLSAARAYAKIAPDADHALHMPSHVFVQLGYWDDASRSNEKAWPASRMPPGGPRQEPGASYHSLQWLQYSYLQQGRWREARALIDTARSIVRNAPADYWGNADARFILSNLLFRYASETGEGWADVQPAVLAAGTDTRSARGAGFSLNAAMDGAVASAMSGDTVPAHAMLARLRARADSAGAQAPVPRRNRDAMLIADVEALLATARGDTTGALAAWERARVADERVPPLGPPTALPTHEWMGELLLRAGQPANAVAAYTRALERRPGRASALRGLARAQSAAGDTASARRTLGILARQWHSADPAVRKLAEARAVGPK